VGEARQILNDAAIPTFRTPEAAVGAFGNIASFYQNQQLLQQTPPPMSDLAKPDVEGARMLIESVLAERRNVLTEMESKALLAAFHIPVTRTILARSANEAIMIATQLGFPVALKIDSPDISHKSDVQGVVLNVLNAVGVRDTYIEMVQTVTRLQPEARINGVTVQNMSSQKRGREINIGMVTDHPFGPVIVFGSGGTMIELINDRAMELPPLNQFLARSLIARARVAETLGEWRGASAIDMEALEQVLLRVSEMVCELRWTSTPSLLMSPVRWRSMRASWWTTRRPACTTTATWRSCPTHRNTSRSGRCVAVVNTRCARSIRTTPACCRILCASSLPRVVTSVLSRACRSSLPACWLASR
jgi:acetyltransferase